MPQNELCEEIFHGVLNGDADAIGAFYDLCTDIMTSFSARIRRSLVLDDPEDLIHDLFVFAFDNDCEKLRGLRDPSKLRSWLWGVINNVIRNRTRVLSNVLKRELPEGDGPADVDALDRATQLALSDAVKKLKKPDRVLVRLIMRDYTQTEIARVLKVSQQEVSRRRAAIFTKLARTLGRAG